MLKLELYNKLIISAVIGSVALLSVGCQGGEAATASVPVSAKAKVQLGIDGGISYPDKNGMIAGLYHVNEQSKGMKINNGRIPNAAEIKAWNTDLQPVTKLHPEGVGIPEGSGSVSDGEDIYEAKCVMCHGDFGSGGGGYPALSKGNAYELQKTLTNNRWKDPEADGPVREFGSYWPQATTLWWYIRDGMPHPFTDSLSADETYALVAYVLNVNEMKIDGALVDDDYVLDRAKFLKIVMPNVNGFEPNITGPNALAVVKKYYTNAKNFGGQNLNQGAVRCMKDCQKPTAKTKYIQHGGIQGFTPKLTAIWDLPKQKAVALDVKKVYNNNCAMCHSSYLAPGSKEWATYTAKGMDKVYANGIKGTEGGMPAKGGTTLSDKDFKTIVDYLVTGKVK